MKTLTVIQSIHCITVLFERVIKGIKLTAIHIIMKISYILLALSPFLPTSMISKRRFRIITYLSIMFCSAISSGYLSPSSIRLLYYIRFTSSTFYIKNGAQSIGALPCVTFYYIFHRLSPPDTVSHVPVRNRTYIIEKRCKKLLYHFLHHNNTRPSVQNNGHIQKKSKIICCNDSCRTSIESPIHLPAPYTAQSFRKAHDSHQFYTSSPPTLLTFFLLSQFPQNLSIPSGFLPIHVL